MKTFTFIIDLKEFTQIIFIGKVNGLQDSLQETSEIKYRVRELEYTKEGVE